MITLVQYSKRGGKLALALLFSVALHFGIYAVIQTVPLINIAMGLKGLEFVEEDYNRLILIDFSKRLTYPPGYLGFHSPTKTRSLEEIKKEEERRARREAEVERRRQERLAREKKENEEREAEAKAKAEDLAKAESPGTPTPTPTPEPKKDGYPGGFGKINTAPIKDQLQRLYEAKKTGKIIFPNDKLKVGVAGNIKSDGTLVDYRLIIPSGVKEIDEAALAILEAVSVSRALGPLHNLTSLSMILEVDQIAQLNVVGFTSSEEEARNLVNLANMALFAARMKKAGDPAAMVMLNNLKVTRTGQRIHAIISVPRQAATDTLSKSMDKGQT